MRESAIHAAVMLTRGFVAYVDIADLPLVADMNWRVQVDMRGTSYAVTEVKGQKVYMHRLLTGASTGELVDHRDMDGLNNCRENLRLATKSTNGANRNMPRNNTSGAKGVTWHSARSKWLAQITVHGCHRYLGIFAERDDAEAAYQKAAFEAFGEFAR